jgi:FkbM family methyltransferase
LNRFEKLAHAIKSPRLAHALVRHRVLAGVEHRHVLLRDLCTVVDIGANRGQFALAVRQWAPDASVISFEPLPGPSSIFRRLFFGDDQVLLHQAAIGPAPERKTIHVSRRDDSSSLLPISSVQTTMFPGTEEIATIEVPVGPLEQFVKPADLREPAMLKLDVQGFEYEALMGCESLLQYFEVIYCECSFVELYLGQKLAWEISDWLSARDFTLLGCFNPTYDRRGHSVQADFLFRRRIGRGASEESLA